MSRIGRLPITVPAGVTVTVSEDNLVTVKGPKGTLTQKVAAALTVKLEAITGKSVELTNRVDSGVLGGVRLDYDGKQMDDTLAHRLGELRSLLNNTIL